MSNTTESNNGFVNGDALLSSDIARLLLQLLLITAFSRLLGLLFRKLKQPQVNAEMCAGILLGPTALGRWSGYREFLFPASSIPLLAIVSQVGLCLFMFVVGMELDIPSLRNRKKATAVVSVLGVVIPCAAAIPLLWLLNDDELLGANANKGVLFLFLGVVLGVSALPVLARIISEYRMHETQLGSFTMAASTLDDVIAWPVLALSIALAGATSLLSVLYTVLLTMANFLVLFIVVRPILLWLSKFHRGEGAPAQGLVFAILFVMFLNAWCTEVIGLTYLIGAFQVGVLVPRRGNLLSSLTERIEDLVVVIFLPLFFTISGLKTQLDAIDSARLWGLTILIIVLANVSKIGSCAFFSRLLAKFSWVDSAAFGIMMNTKGLVALISVNLGLEYDIIKEPLFSMFLVMILFNTLLTGPALWFLYRVVRQQMPGKSQDKKNGKVARTAMALVTDTDTAPLLISLGSALPAVSSRLILVRYLEGVDRPSVYMGNFWRKAKHRDAVLKVSLARARAADAVLTVDVLCEAAGDHLHSQLLRAVTSQDASMLFISLTSVSSLSAPEIAHIRRDSPCPVLGLLLLLPDEDMNGESSPMLAKAAKASNASASLSTESEADLEKGKATDLHSVGSTGRMAAPTSVRRLILPMSAAADEDTLALALLLASGKKLDLIVLKLETPLDGDDSRLESSNRLLAQAQGGAGVEVRFVDAREGWEIALAREVARMRPTLSEPHNTAVMLPWPRDEATLQHLSAALQLPLLLVSHPHRE